MRLALIGFGNIAQTLLEVLAREGAPPETVQALVRAPDRPALRARAAVAGVVLTGDRGALLAMEPDLVVECAGQGAVETHIPACLSAGVDCIVASVGALADATLHARLDAAARTGRSRLVLPAGAIGAVDLLAALRLSGIGTLRYTGRKPPMAWTDTPAEALVDLRGLRAPAVFFEGTAREAAVRFHKNANVAATLAVAGPGFDAVAVRLIADPGITVNVHEIDASASAADFSIRIEGKPSPDNPRTSLATVYSIARAILNRRAGIVV